MGEDGVVQQDQGTLVRHADLELRSQHRHAGLGDRVHVLDSLDPSPVQG